MLYAVLVINFTRFVLFYLFLQTGSQITYINTCKLVSTRGFNIIICYPIVIRYCLNKTWFPNVNLCFQAGPLMVFSSCRGCPRRAGRRLQAGRRWPTSATHSALRWCIRGTPYYSRKRVYIQILSSKMIILILVF